MFHISLGFLEVLVWVYVKNFIGRRALPLIWEEFSRNFSEVPDIGVVGFVCQPVQTDAHCTRISLYVTHKVYISCKL